MLSNNQIKEIRSLKQKKYRQKYDKFIVEGHKSSVEFLRSGKYFIKNIFALESWIKLHRDLLHPYREVVITINDKEMEKISMLKTHSDVILVCQIPSSSVNLALNEKPVVFYLDDVQDPGNVGTIIRIADWFGINTIICSPDSADIYNAKVIQASMGSICNVDIFNLGINELNIENNEHSIIGTDMNGSPLKDFVWPEKVIVVFGNEGRGISSNTKSFIDFMITIGGSEKRIAESLNVANAVAIIAHSIFAD